MVNIRFGKNSLRTYILVGTAVVLAGLLMYRFLAPTVSELLTSDEEIALKHKKLVKYQNRLQEDKALPGQLAVTQKKLEQSESSLLSGKTIALTAVEVQKMLIEITGKSGVDIMSIRILPTRDIENMPYQAIPVQITVSSNIRQLVDVLYAVNSSAKLLHTVDFDIRSSGLQDNEKVQASLTVEGFMKKVENPQE